MGFGASAVSWCSEVASTVHQKIFTNRWKPCWLSIAFSSFIDFRLNVGSEVESNSVKKRSTILENSQILDILFCESEWVRGRAGSEDGRDGPTADAKFGKTRFQQDGRRMKHIMQQCAGLPNTRGGSPYKTNQLMGQGSVGPCILPCVLQEHRGRYVYIYMLTFMYMYMYIYTYTCA